ncbi:thiol-disulfide isomerase/thioredoxin [Pantoea sp. AN62]|jgi:thiol-disulfide isomerase/thioredoxin|uniref:Thiol-disulfide isomerase/thioredoxin n=1 Tax=Enterobacter agglomerans TaxID=549 RepID=A0ABD6XLF1_ENTAG|nr:MULTISPECIES: redoxin domain-containing protein [Erwiniaceae]ORM52743.1 hypothetical protein HA39_20195 [Pantoea brenneri]MCH9408178.1 redoxin family protein [Pantoea agglomerans]NKE96775.1 redoxin family protein [Pantoea agglomerans]OXM19269.1 hypothetical protein CBI35_20840 [Pantoea sp. AV62]QTC52507.1 redoxin family protein [Pantoea agglomerans]
MMHLRKWLIKLTCFILFALPVILVVDWLRFPELPADSAYAELTLLDGSVTTLSALSERQPLVIYYWAGWCPVCKLTTPLVADMAARGNNVLAVALRSGNDQQVSRLMSGYRLQASGINDADGKLANRWQITVTPTFLIVYKGKVASATSGWTSRWGLQFRLWLAEFTF